MMAEALDDDDEIFVYMGGDQQVSSSDSLSLDDDMETEELEDEESEAG